MRAHLNEDIGIADIGPHRLANRLGFASPSPSPSTTHSTRHRKLMFDELPSETRQAHGMTSSGQGVRAAANQPTAPRSDPT